MNVENIPKFTRPAAKLWAKVPSEFKKRLLSKLWCAQCCGAVTITDFTGKVIGGDLLLEGQCAVCREGVARVVEMN